MSERLGVIDGTVMYPETRAAVIMADLDREAAVLASVVDGETAP